MPRIAIVLALELIDEAIDFGFSKIANLRSHVSSSLMRAGPHPRALTRFARRPLALPPPYDHCEEAA